MSEDQSQQHFMTEAPPFVDWRAHAAMGNRSLASEQYRKLQNIWSGYSVPGLKELSDYPGEHAPRIPIDDRHQVDEAARHRDVGDDASYTYTYGELLYHAGRYDDAKPVLEKAAELPEAVFSLRAGAPDEAAVSVQRSLELDPAFPDAWSMLGSLLLDSGHAEEALECYLKAAALEPSNAAVHLNLASPHAALGNDAAEEAAMERYHELTKR